MEFKKYQHVERFGNDEVDGIEIGTCHVFPKIDGTNASTWICRGSIKAGSRNRELTLDSDNAGFYKWVTENPNIIQFHSDNPHLRLFGEWLVPHSLKTYRKDSWDNFYVFDVMNESDEYLPYDIYQPLLEEYGINYIPPLAIVKDAEYDQLCRYLKINNFLVEDGKGVGEGIVLKNYSYKNKYGRTTWAKIVTSEFKEKHHKEMGAPTKEFKMLEREIADKYVTSGRVEKIYNNIKISNEGWRSQYIPRLLQTVYYDLVKEEMWDIVKEFKNPKINFKTLQSITIEKVKEHKPELF